MAEGQPDDTGPFSRDWERKVSQEVRNGGGNVFTALTTVSYKEQASKQCGEVAIPWLDFRANSATNCTASSTSPSPSGPSVFNEE